MPEASSADPGIDQLVDAVQLITKRLENLNGTVSPTRRVDDDPSDETKTERKIVGSRALLHLRCFKMPQVSRTWKNHFVVQLGKLDISGEGILHEWISAAFNSGSDPGLLEGLELPGQVPRWIHGLLRS